MQRSEDKTPEDLLQILLDQQNANKRRSAEEIVQKKPENAEKDLGMRVVPLPPGGTQLQSHATKRRRIGSCVTPGERRQLEQM